MLGFRAIFETGCREGAKKGRKMMILTVLGDLILLLLAWVGLYVLALTASTDFVESRLPFLQRYLSHVSSADGTEKTYNKSRYEQYRQKANPEQGLPVSGPGPEPSGRVREAQPQVEGGRQGPTRAPPVQETQVVPRPQITTRQEVTQPRKGPGEIPLQSQISPPSKSSPRLESRPHCI